jgi:hypothetical protein
VLIRVQPGVLARAAADALAQDAAQAARPTRLGRHQIQQRITFPRSFSTSTGGTSGDSRPRAGREDRRYRTSCRRFGAP